MEENKVEHFPAFWAKLKELVVLKRFAKKTMRCRQHWTDMSAEWRNPKPYEWSFLEEAIEAHIKELRQLQQAARRLRSKKP